MVKVDSEERQMSDWSRRSVLIGLPVVALVASGQVILAADSLPLTTEKRVALKGYDPVSYFMVGHPEKGSVEYQAVFDDTTYWFKSAEHRALFNGDPDHYAPQFRGYCTNTMSRGEYWEADPEAWAIVDGKLYVVGSKKGLARFQNQTAGAIEMANENWANFRGR
jgi:YHS domain-containing protein